MKDGIESCEYIRAWNEKGPYEAKAWNDKGPYTAKSYKEDTCSSYKEDIGSRELNRPFGK